MTTNVYTIAVLRAKPGKVEELITVLEQLATETRKEAGAEEYGFIRDTKSSDVVLSYERWRDADAEAAHWKTAHLAAALAKFDALLDGDAIIHKGTKII